jgi:hypothetical protein
MLNYQMRSCSTLALLLLVMFFTGQFAIAQDTGARYSQSIEGQVITGVEKTYKQLDKVETDEHQQLVISGSRIESTVQRNLAADAKDQILSVFNAYTEISRDDDDDGFYQHLKVVFDADTSDTESWVYAKLYLSLEGGPWNHYYTTDVFLIQKANLSDEYEVVTRLMDGYQTGYYDVLIELYDADFDLLEVNYGPYEDSDLAALPLEDSDRDQYNDYGGGGASSLSTLLLGLLALVKGYSSYRTRYCIRSVKG